MFNQISIQNQIRPPLQDEVVGTDRIVTSIWLRYFNNLYQLLVAILQKGISLPSLTTSQRDSDSSYNQQRWLYITDAAAGKEVQININGIWYYATLTAV
jgi:hypothetical protein